MRALRRWFWRRPGGCLPSKRRRAVTSPLTTSGDTADELAGYGLPSPPVICAGMPMREVAGEAFRHLDLDFELAQVDHAQHRRVGGDVRCAAATCTWPTWPSNGARSVERVDLALQVGDDRALAIGEQALVARVQAGALALQPVVLARRGPAPSVGLLQRVLRARDVDLRDRAAFEARAGCAPGRARRPGGRSRPGRAACARWSAPSARRARRGWPRLQAGQRRLLLRELAAQLRAVDLGQRLALA